MSWFIPGKLLFVVWQTLFLWFSFEHFISVNLNHSIYREHISFPCTCTKYNETLVVWRMYFENTLELSCRFIRYFVIQIRIDFSLRWTSPYHQFHQFLQYYIVTLHTHACILVPGLPLSHFLRPFISILLSTQSTLQQLIRWKRAREQRTNTLFDGKTFSRYRQSIKLIETSDQSTLISIYVQQHFCFDELNEQKIILTRAFYVTRTFRVYKFKLNVF